MKNPDAEKDIIKAARKVFYEKGFDKATMRDIASEANTNLAMVNYYFRSKENLFYMIFDETMVNFLNGIIGVIEDKQTCLEEKIKTIIYGYFDVFKENKYIPSFLMGELIRNPDKVSIRIKNNLDKFKLLATLDKILKKENEKGNIKQIQGFTVFIQILSLVFFPIISKPVYKEILNFNSVELEEYIEEHKKSAVRMIMANMKK